MCVARIVNNRAFRPIIMIIIVMTAASIVVDHRVLLFITHALDFSLFLYNQGIGTKMALSLITRYKSMESVLKNILLDPRWRKKILRVRTRQGEHRDGILFVYDDVTDMRK